MTKTERLREALERYGQHDSDCLCDQWREGRPTENGGYETLYGYGKHGRWYKLGESPKCTCGLSEAITAKSDVCVWAHDERGWHSGCPEGDWLSTIALSAIGFCAKDGLLDTMYCPGCGKPIEVKE